MCKFKMTPTSMEFTPPPFIKCMCALSDKLNFKLEQGSIFTRISIPCNQAYHIALHEWSRVAASKNISIVMDVFRIGSM